MFHIILYQPEIPPNTGNIIRLCANTGTRLHLIEPLGFELDDKRLRRAGLDYHELAHYQVHPNWQSCMHAVNPDRVFALSTKGTQRYSDMTFLPNDAFLLGPETRGLPLELLNQFPPSHVLCIPQAPGARSLNLSNATAVILFEAWRQNDFIVRI